MPCTFEGLSSTAEMDLGGVACVCAASSNCKLRDEFGGWFRASGLAGALDRDGLSLSGSPSDTSIMLALAGWASATLTNESYAHLLWLA